jgi:polysaccharide pyruvyl transferase WcaK-like protein
MKSAGVPVVQSFDCLPLHIKRIYERPEEAAGSIVIAGSVAWKFAGIKAFSSYIKHMHHLGYEVRVLTGAKALPAPDDCDFVKTLLQNCPVGWKPVEARSMKMWLDTIACSRLLVSGRFHHTIAAAVLGKPFILLESNTPKNEGIARIFGSCWPLSYKDKDLLSLMIEQSEKVLSGEYAGQKDMCYPLVDSLCELAEKNFIGLESL